MSQVIDQDETYTYEILQEKDCIECATLLAHSFTEHNTYELYMKTTYEQFYTDALSLCKAILSTNLSVIARHKQTNEIHGIVQGVDAKTFDGGEDAASATDDDTKRVDPILEVMHEFERQYLEDYGKKYGELKENSVVQILMAGVRPDCSGQGGVPVVKRCLGTKLNQVLLEHARRQGFKHVIVDASNPAIHHIYTKKLNGTVFTSIYAPTWISKNGNGDDYRPLEHFNAEITFIVFDL